MNLPHLDFVIFECEEKKRTFVKVIIYDLHVSFTQSHHVDLQTIYLIKRRRRARKSKHCKYKYQSKKRMLVPETNFSCFHMVATWVGRGGGGQPSNQCQIETILSPWLRLHMFANHYLIPQILQLIDSSVFTI